MRCYDTVLLVQDTTQLNYSGQKHKSGIGPLNRDNHRGILLHPTIAVTDGGLCLGVIDDLHWYRKSLHHQSQHEKNRINIKTPISEKESYRFVRDYQIANQVSKKIPKTRIVSVSDREGDIYDLYQESNNQKREENPAHWLVRSRRSRPLLNESGKKSCLSLWEVVAQEEPCCNIEFTLPPNKGCATRQVTQAIRVKRVTLHPPTGRRGKLRCEAVEVNALIATEIAPPAGEVAIEWFFITSLPIDTPSSSKQILQYYLCRWQIEVFFRIYKSGCQVEELQLENEKRMSPCLALYLIIAWRILYMAHASRHFPDVPCEIIFDKEEWHAIYMVTKKKAPPQKSPSLYSMIRMLATLGGFLNRKSDDEPGPKALWIGLQRIKGCILINQIYEASNQRTYG